MDPDSLVSGLSDVRFWGVLGIAALCGAIGAWVRPRDPTEQTERPSTFLSWLRTTGRDLITGAIAAVAVIYVSAPKTASALVGGSLVAGYGANALLAALQARAIAQLAKEQLVAAEDGERDAVDEATQANARARDAERDFDELARATGGNVTFKQLADELRARRA